jgi:hypothetical protein
MTTCPGNDNCYYLLQGPTQHISLPVHSLQLQFSNVLFARAMFVWLHHCLFIALSNVESHRDTVHMRAATTPAVVGYGGGAEKFARQPPAQDDLDGATAMHEIGSQR